MIKRFLIITFFFLSSFRHQHIYPLLRTRWTWELHQLRFLFSIFEEQNSCYASDSILCGYVGTVISVKLEACNFSSILFRQLINGRGYHPVWTTPWCNGVSLAMTMLFQLESVTARTAKQGQPLTTTQMLALWKKKIINSTQER